jgi:hypothetical protein
MTKPILQVINGGTLGGSEIDAAIAAIEFAPALERAAAEWLAGRAERAFAAAEQATAAVAILAKTKTELVAMLTAAGGDQAAEAHAALKGAFVGADALVVAVLRAAEVRFAIARAAAHPAADH